MGHRHKRGLSTALPPPHSPHPWTSPGGGGQGRVDHSRVEVFLAKHGSQTQHVS
jgi:hypothetical protein